jgi:hypothetical protein
MKVFQANDKPGLNAYTPGPMSAGDIIDLAVRIYRRQALPLLQIVLLPSLISYAGMIIFSIGFSNFSTLRGDRRVLLTSLLIIGGAGLYLLGKAVFYAVLGGASRSFFHYLLGQDKRGGTAAPALEPPPDDRPFRVGEVYLAVRTRFGAMVGAMLLLPRWGSICSSHSRSSSTSPFTSALSAHSRSPSRSSPEVFSGY